MLEVRVSLPDVKLLDSLFSFPLMWEPKVPDSMTLLLLVEMKLQGQEVCKRMNSDKDNWCSPLLGVKEFVGRKP